MDAAATSSRKVDEFRKYEVDRVCLFVSITYLRPATINNFKNQIPYPHKGNEIGFVGSCFAQIDSITGTSGSIAYTLVLYL